MVDDFEEAEQSLHWYEIAAEQSGVLRPESIKFIAARIHRMDRERGGYTQAEKITVLKREGGPLTSDEKRALGLSPRVTIGRELALALSAEGLADPARAARLVANLGFEARQLRYYKMAKNRGPKAVTDIDPFNLNWPAAAEWAREHAGERLVGIDEFIRRRIADLVAGSHLGEVAVTKLPWKIQDVTGLYPEVAKLIANFEFSRSCHMGSIIDARRSDAKFGRRSAKQWIVSPNSHIYVCPACEANAAIGRIALDRPFPSGDQAPPHRPDCGCDLRIVNLDGDLLAR